METFSGKVCWFNSMRGFGFIEWEIKGVKQKDLFVHFSDIVCEGFKNLYKAQSVTFGIGENKHGDPKAIEVTVLGTDQKPVQVQRQTQSRYNY